MSESELRDALREALNYIDGFLVTQCLRVGKTDVRDILPAHEYDKLKRLWDLLK